VASGLVGEQRDEPWLTPGGRAIGTASLLADLGHEVPTALPPSLLTSTLGAPAAALGLIEGVADGLAGSAKLAGGALLSSLVGVATSSASGRGVTRRSGGSRTSSTPKRASGR
jgi:hypothetical protein